MESKDEPLNFLQSIFFNNNNNQIVSSVFKNFRLRKMKIN